MTTQKRKYKRGNHFKAAYPNDAFKLHNEMRMMNKIKGRFKDEAHERAFNEMNEGALKDALSKSEKDKE